MKLKGMEETTWFPVMLVGREARWRKTENTNTKKSISLLVDSSLQFPAHCVSLGVWLESESKLLGKIIVSLEFSCPQDWPLYGLLCLYLFPWGQLITKMSFSHPEMGRRSVSLIFRVLGIQNWCHEQLSFLIALHRPCQIDTGREVLRRMYYLTTQCLFGFIFSNGTETLLVTARFTG